MTEAKLEEILKEIRLVNRLLAHSLVADLETVKDKSMKLLEIGLRPKDVAAVLRVPIGTVTKSRSRAKGKTKH